MCKHDNSQGSPHRGSQLARRGLYVGARPLCSHMQPCVQMQHQEAWGHVLGASQGTGACLIVIIAEQAAAWALAIACRMPLSNSLSCSRLYQVLFCSLRGSQSTSATHI